MIGRRRLSKKVVIEALENTYGQVYLAAKRLGCSHTTIYNYINKYPDIAELKERLEEETTDIAVIKQREAVLGGEPWAIQFQLRTKGKHRGYVERQEVAGVEDQPFNVIIKPRGD